MIQVGKVGMIPRSSIVISDRTREVMGNLDDLENSMKESGLITPLAFQDLKDGRYLLLAGERRFRILEKNEVPEIPARIYDSELSPMELKIIEKSENFFRKEMEYWEYDKLTLEITRMQQELKGVASPGIGGGHSLSDTGDMLGVSKATVSLAMKRAELREQMPEVFENCKTAADAEKVIKKINEAVITQSIAQEIESKADVSSLTAHLSKAFILRNVFEGIKEIPPGVFHLVEIDPPYSIALMDKKKSDGESQYQKENYNEVPTSIYMDGSSDNSWKGMKTLFKECYRVMSDHSWLICWFGPDPWFEQIYKAITEAGFETTRLCGIWTKPGGQTNQPGMYLPNAYEMFFYAWKGRPAIAKPRGGNVFNTPPIPGQQKVHPTERPPELMREIYETFAFPGSRVLIPFLGSGNGLIAASSIGMTGIGFELTKAYKDSFLVKVHSMCK